MSCGRPLNVWNGIQTGCEVKLLCWFCYSYSLCHGKHVQRNLVEISHSVHYRCWCSEPFWDPLRPVIEFQTGFVYMIYAALTAVWLQPLMHSNETMNMLLKEEGDETSESWFVVSLPAAEDWFHYSLSTHKGVSILMALEQEILMLLCGFLNSEQIKQWASCNLPNSQVLLAVWLFPLTCLIPSVQPFGYKWKAFFRSPPSGSSANFDHSVPHCMNSSLHVNAITVELSVWVSVFSNC